MPGPGDIKMGASMDASAAQKEVARLSKDMAKLQKAFDKLAKSGKKGTEDKIKVDKKAMELDRQRKRVLEQIMTPQERYNRKIKELRTLLARNKLTQDQYRRAVRQTHEEQRKAWATGKQAFGAGAIRQLTSMAAGVVSVTAAVSVLRRAWDAVATARKGAAEKQRAAFHGLGSLAQLAETPEEMAELTGMAGSLYMAGGAASLDEAGRTIFSIISAGGKESAKLFGQLTGRGLIEDPAAMIRAQKTLMASMGRKETGGFRALTSKAFGASKYTPARVEELLEATAKSGTSAAVLGISDEEILAATALVSEAKGSAEMGGTYLAQMMRTLKQKGIQGQTLGESLRAIETMGLDQAGLKKWFGRAQGQEAYEVLIKQMPLYERALRDVRTAEREDRVGAKLRLFDADPVIGYEMLRRQAVAVEEMGLQGEGAWQQRSETARAKMRTINREDIGMFRASVQDWFEGIDEYFQGPEHVARDLESKLQKMEENGDESLQVLKDIRDNLHPVMP